MRGLIQRKLQLLDLGLQIGDPLVGCLLQDHQVKHLLVVQVDLVW